MVIAEVGTGVGAAASAGTAARAVASVEAVAGGVIHVVAVLIQAHLGDKVHGDKIKPKVGKHKVQEVKNP